jgi:hypothetical protein
MKSLQLPLVIAFVVAISIVNLHHFAELLGWFTLGAIGFCGLHYAFFAQSQSQEVQQREEVARESQCLEQVIPLLFQDQEKITDELTIGTDLWTKKHKSDAVETEPTHKPMPLGVELLEENLIIQQLETLPQKKGRRQVWAALCEYLAIKGGGKVRDASLINKAKFLQSQQVKIPDLIKAKVVAMNYSPLLR